MIIVALRKLTTEIGERSSPFFQVSGTLRTLTSLDPVTMSDTLAGGLDLYDGMLDKLADTPDWSPTNENVHFLPTALSTRVT